MDKPYAVVDAQGREYARFTRYEFADCYAWELARQHIRDPKVIDIRTNLKAQPTVK